MKRQHFLAKINEEKITTAIARAEAKTTGQISVFISHRRCPNPLPIARKHFEHLSVSKAPHHNGMFIFVAPESQTFALVGDAGIHDKCGDIFWQALRDEMIPQFKAERYTEGIVHAIQKAGDLLATHFPRSDQNRNDLQNVARKD